MPDRPSLQDLSAARDRYQGAARALVRLFNDRYPKGSSVTWVTAQGTIARGIVESECPLNHAGDLRLWADNTKTGKTVCVRYDSILAAEQKEDSHA
jgi:hypothetical protein